MPKGSVYMDEKTDEAMPAIPEVLSDEEISSIIRAEIAGLRIIDNAMFQLCVKDNPEFVEHLLRPIVKEIFGENDDIKIVELRIEDIQVNAVGKGIRLDAVAEDEKGRLFCVEVQRKTDLNELKYRVRFYHGLFDANLLKPGHEYKELPETHVCFLCEGDPRGLGKPTYESWEVWKDDGTLVDDKTSSIYTNGKWRGDDRIGRLNHDLMCANPDEMFDDVLATAVRNLKVGGKDEEKMYDAMDAMFGKYLGKYREGFIQEGAKLNMQSQAKVIIDMKLSEKDTRKFFEKSGYPPEDIKKYMAMANKKRGIAH